MKGKAKLGIKGSDMIQAWDEAIFYPHDRLFWKLRAEPSKLCELQSDARTTIAP
jgi:hypothetical protein